MRMLNERLQVLIDRAQRERLDRESVRRGTSVATLVREAIDAAFPSDADEREAAGARILAAEPMPVPDVDELVAELAELRGRQ